jgi:hypothetical protein
MNKRLLTITMALGLAALLTGCGLPAKITGGGSLPSAEGGNAKAHFGFNAQDCGDEGLPETEFNGTGQFNYNDKAAGVKFHAEVLEANQCRGFTEDGDDLGLACNICADLLAGAAVIEPIDDFERATLYLEDNEFKGIALNYRSTNPKNRGEGNAVVCAADWGEGANAEGANGFMFVGVLSGPYDGYLNIPADSEGQPIGVQGNIQMHSCPGEGGNGNNRGD